MVYMKKFLTVFFVTLGVVFFILISMAVYFFVTDPLNLKPILFGREQVEVQGNEIHEIGEVTGSTTTEVDRNPMLNATQEKALDAIGVNPANIPTQFSSEQEICFGEKLGVDRVEEIKAGDLPSAAEFFKARECL